MEPVQLVEVDDCRSEACNIQNEPGCVIVPERLMPLYPRDTKAGLMG